LYRENSACAEMARLTEMEKFARKGVSATAESGRTGTGKGEISLQTRGRAGRLWRDFSFKRQINRIKQS